MTALQHDHIDDWARIKTTVAEALQDALAVIDEAVRRDGMMTIPDYMNAMDVRGVTAGAANDTIRFLTGTRAIVLTDFGDITRPKDGPAAPEH